MSRPTAGAGGSRDAGLARLTLGLAVAILAFTGGAAVAIELRYAMDERVAPLPGAAAAQAADVPGEPPAPSPSKGELRPPPVARPVAPAPARVAVAGTASAAGNREAAPLRVAAPVPVPPAGPIEACVEQRLAAAGPAEPPATLPGRWPAMKRARDERRRLRVALRAECEREDQR